MCLAPTLIFGPDVLFAHMLIVAFRQNPHLEARSCAGAGGGGNVPVATPVQKTCIYGDIVVDLSMVALDLERLELGYR